MAVKQKRIKCARCGERETVMRGERRMLLPRRGRGGDHR